MEQLVRAVRADNGQFIEGCFCYHEFIKSAASLTDEEKAAGTPIPVPSTGNAEGDSGESLEPTEYVCIREAVQTLESREITVKSGDDDVVITAKVAVFTEIQTGSAKMFTGFIDKNDVKIFEGDKIRYQAGVTSFETYTVVFNDGKFCVSPQWQWGCSFSPFEKRKVEVV